ncbi:hypothetical protein AG1IA_01685 [Rhizoctonia solani AG-1 IA]|uniref:Uncharacterized protein n=1 Tax=Thanatephorus cucumeris (strain AG1-IA) TaxID=983506 RepID=L8X5J4_THACA|nr:hypothetical protein AG1IA_01685 [Rhizoctonia solani AG-1 IA]
MDSRDVEDEAAPLLTSELMSNTPVWPIIHEIKADVMQFIEQPISYFLLPPEPGPLPSRPKHIDRPALTDASRTVRQDMDYSPIRSLREHADSTLQLATACTTPWPIFAGAPEQVRDFAEKNADEFDIRERVGNAIEMAIVGSMPFIGVILFIKPVPITRSSLMAQTYKLKPIHFYDPHRAPLLNHYRLKVPVIRGVLEYIKWATHNSLRIKFLFSDSFVLLFVLFVVALELNEKSTINMPEGLFMIYGLGFVIEKLAAMQEHGIRVYSSNVRYRPVLTFGLLTIYSALERLYGIRWDEAWARELGIDILAVVVQHSYPGSFAHSVIPSLWTYSDAPWAKPLEQAMGIYVCFIRSRIPPTIWTSPNGAVTYFCVGCITDNDAAMEAMFRRAVSTIEGLDGERYHDQVRLIRLILGKLGGSSFAILRITGFPILLAISFYERQKAAAEAESMFEKVTNVAERFVTLPRRLKRMSGHHYMSWAYALNHHGLVQAIFELDDEFNPSPIIGDSLTWPCQLESSESEPPPLPSEKFKRPERPKLDTIMSASSAGEGQSISERTPRPTGSNQLGGPYHEIALENHNGAFQANSSRDQIPSSISTQLNNGFLAPIQRRNRRKSTFEPRLVPNRTEAASLSVPPANFTSPLAQLFSPIISEPPDGGFNAPNTTIGQRRTLRKSGGDQQTAPGVAMFRRRALTGMVGGAGTSSSALSTTPGEEKEPSEAGNLEDDDNWISLRARMTQMEDKLQRVSPTRWTSTPTTIVGWPASATAVDRTIVARVIAAMGRPIISGNLTPEAVAPKFIPSKFLLGKVAPTEIFAAKIVAPEIITSKFVEPKVVSPRIFSREIISSIVVTTVSSRPGAWFPAAIGVRLSRPIPVKRSGYM